MSALDIFVILLLGGGAMIGFVRGLVHEVLSLLAWVAAIVMLRLFHEPISASLGEAVGSATGAAVLAFVLLFLPSFLFMKLLARSIGKRTRKSVLGPVDRVLGGGFGMLKGCWRRPSSSCWPTLRPTSFMGLRPTGPSGCVIRAPTRCSTPAAGL